MNNREQNAFYLYGAFSEADSRFVDEMLDDGLAETIRARNKRKKIRMTSAFSAAAAVLVAVVCIGIVPKAKLASKDSGGTANSITYNENKHGNMAAGENADGDTLNLAPEQQEETPAAPETQNTAPPIEQYQSDDEAEKDENAPSYEEQTDREETGADSAAKPDSISSANSVKPSGASSESGMIDDFAAFDDFDDITSKDKGGETTEENKSEETPPAVPENTVFETVSLSQNLTFVLGEKVSANHRGRFLAEGDGFAVYEFDNCDHEMIVTVEKDGEYRAAVRGGILPETIGELYYGLDLKRYLRCDGIEGSNESYGDERFRAEVWDKIFADPDKSPRTDDEPQTDGVTFLCRLGNDDETFVRDIKITMYDDGTVGFTALGVSGRYVIP